MSVKIRLTRVGKTHQISYRLIVTDTRSKRDGRFLEILGFYNPHKKSEDSFKIDKQKLEYWLSKGAKPTVAVTKLLSNEPTSVSTDNLNSGEVRNEKLDQSSSFTPRTSHFNCKPRD